MTDDYSQSRVILNANRGVTNVIDYDIIKHDLRGVLDKIFNTLKGHYGPFSGFAAVDTRDPLKETQFTKDGIGILRAMECASPQEDWIRKTVAYIGAKMETAVGDGTTSSMMFTCAMLKHMLEHIKEIRPVSYNRLRNEFNKFVDTIKTELNEVSVKPYKEDGQTVDPILVKKIVFNQVYTSSHGDTELANALADIYAQTPPEIWDRMRYERLRYETDTRFTVIPSDGQYDMTCEIMSANMCNKDLGIWFERDNCTLIVMNDTVRIDTDAYDKIKEEAAKATPEKPLVIIAHKRMDTTTYQDFNSLLDKANQNDRPIAFFSTTPFNPSVNDYVSIQLLNDLDITKYQHGEFAVFEGVYAKYRNEHLVLDKLYAEPDEYKDRVERHHCLDGKHNQFCDYLEGVKKLADGMVKLDLQASDQEKITLMYRMYAKLRYKHTAVLRIGGHALDNIALVDVVDDCQRASSKALTHGIVLGNNRSLYQIVRDIVQDTDPDTTKYDYGWWFASRIKESLEDIALVVLEKLAPDKKFKTKELQLFLDWWFREPVDLLEFEHGSDPELTCNDNWVKFWKDQNSFAFDSLRDCIYSWTRPIIVQPANSDISMLTRFAEVALKYVLTERIIVRGAAYVNDGSSKK